MANNRNAPCSCGSKQKFKKCCGNPATLAVKRREDNEKFIAQVQAKAAEREKADAEAKKAGKNTRPLSPLMAAAMMAAVLYPLDGGGRLR